MIIRFCRLIQYGKHCLQALTHNDPQEWHLHFALFSSKLGKNLIQWFCSHTQRTTFLTTQYIQYWYSIYYGTKRYSYLIPGNFLKTLPPNLKKTTQFSQVSIHFHPWVQTAMTSFSALQWLLTRKVQHQFLVFVDGKRHLSVVKFCYPFNRFNSSIGGGHPLPFEG